MLSFNTKKGEELKVPYYASVAATRDGNLPPIAMTYSSYNYYCLNYKIVPIYMPAHSSHLLQPLDVGCFLALKQAYGRSVK